MISVGNNFYLTGYDNIWKTNEQFNVLIHNKSNVYNSPGYWGLYYNSTNDLIYVAALDKKEIHVLNLDLTLNDTFSTAPYLPWSINEYNNQLYVGTESGNGAILVIVNKQIIKQFNACNGKSATVYSILFDQFDNLATVCSDSQINLYNINGDYLNKYISIYPYYISFDSKSRLVAVAESEITIFS